MRSRIRYEGLFRLSRNLLWIMVMEKESELLKEKTLKLNSPFV